MKLWELGSKEMRSMGSEARPLELNSLISCASLFCPINDTVRL